MYTSMPTYRFIGKDECVSDVKIILHRCIGQQGWLIFPSWNSIPQHIACDVNMLHIGSLM